MIIPDPTQWAANDGDETTAAIFNERIRDPINFLKNHPMTFLRRTGTDSIPVQTAIILPWDIEDFDSDDCHSNSPQHRFTSKNAGYYHCVATMQFDADIDSNVNRRVGLIKNSSLSITDHAENGNGNTVHGFHVQTSCIVFLDVGEYIEVYVQQYTSGSLNVGNDGRDAHFSVRWVSAP